MSTYMPKENIFSGEYFDVGIYRDRFNGYSDNLTSYEYDMVFRTNKKYNVINPPIVVSVPIIPFAVTKKSVPLHIQHGDVCIIKR